jgi:hypothetical protein
MSFPQERLQQVAYVAKAFLKKTNKPQYARSVMSVFVVGVFSALQPIGLYFPQSGGGL